MGPSEWYQCEVRGCSVKCCKSSGIRPLTKRGNWVHWWVQLKQKQKKNNPRLMTLGFQLLTTKLCLKSLELWRLGEISWIRRSVQTSHYVSGGGNTCADSRDHISCAVTCTVFFSFSLFIPLPPPSCFVSCRKGNSAWQERSLGRLCLSAHLGCSPEQPGIPE